jgi:hypothetical protein
MLTIVAFDPGGATGYAVYRGWDDPAVEKFSCGTFTGPSHHALLYTHLGSLRRTNNLRTSTSFTNEMHVVTESFEYRNQSRAGLELISRDYIGVIELFCQHNSLELHRQTASMGKGFVKDIHLKRLGLWSSGKEERHAMDAYRHLLYYMIHTLKGPIGLKLLERGWKSP